MGQYYIPTFIKENGQINILEGHSFSCGIKLMEHSWIGNEFVNAAYAVIYHKTRMVAWVGDYSNEPYNVGEEPYTLTFNKLDFAQIYRLRKMFTL